MKKHKIIAFLLSIVISLTFTPTAVLSAIADETKQVTGKIGTLIEKTKETTKADTTDYIETDSLAITSDDEKFIEKELVEKRTINSKQFLLTDGSISVQTFAKPIHYIEDNAFKEIDNSLQLKTDSTGKKYYENKANSFKVKLINTLEIENKTIIEKDGYSLEFSLLPTSNKQLSESTATVKEQEESFSVKNKEINKNADANSMLEKIGDTDEINYSGKKIKDPIQPKIEEYSVKYSNVFKDTDFEYSIKSHGLKEDIILNAPCDDYNFYYLISAPNLTLCLYENGEIYAESANGDKVFVIPAPNMIDGNGEYSENIEYVLTEIEKGVYKLKISPNEEWLNQTDRVFPVKIDPAINPVTSDDINGLTATYDAVTAKDEIKFGIINLVPNYGFLCFNDKNTYFNLLNHKLVSSKLNYHIRSGDSGRAGYALYTAQSEVPFSKITKSSQLSFLNNSKLFEGIIEASTNKSENVFFDPESFDDRPDIIFAWADRPIPNSSRQHGIIDISGNYAPSIICNFVSTSGLKENLPYETFDYLGGTASVNLLNGELNASFNLLSTGTLNNPLSLQLFYNDDYYDDVMTVYGIAPMFGSKFKLNVQQAIKHENDNFITYIDEDGSVETLIRDDDTNSTYHSLNNSISIYEDTHQLLYKSKQQCYSFNGKYLTNIYTENAYQQRDKSFKVLYSDEKGYISKVYGFTNDEISHYFNFIYSTIDGKKVVTRIDSYIIDVGYSLSLSYYRLLSSCYFSYDDSNKNLTKISLKPVNEVETVLYSLNYDDDKLKTIIDSVGNGYLFIHTIWSSSNRLKMESVVPVYGKGTDYAEHYEFYCDLTVFYADEKTTTVTYKQSGMTIGTKYLSHMFNSGAYSEKYVEPNGDTYITMTATKTENDASQSGNTAGIKQTKTTAVTKQKRNVTIEENEDVTKSENGLYVIVPSGKNVTCHTNGQHGIPQNKAGANFLSFTITTTGSSFVQVKYGNEILADLAFNGSTEYYCAVPFGHFSTNSKSFSISNAGLNYIIISDISYNVAATAVFERVIQTKTNLSIPFNYIKKATVTTFNRREEATYNEDGQPIEQKTDIYNENSTIPITETTAYTYEFAEDSLSYPSTKRLKSISDGETTTTYSYTSSIGTDRLCSTNTISSVTTKNGTTISSSSTTTQNEVFAYTIKSVNNGVTNISYYGVKSGNIRLLKTIECNGTASCSHPADSTDNIITYDYDGAGNLKTVNQNGVIIHSNNYIGGKINSFGFSSTETFTLVRDTNKGQVTEIKHNYATMLSYTYNNYGNVSLITFANGATIAYNYRQDNKELTSVTLKNSANATPTTIEYEYNSDGEIKNVTQKENDVTQIKYEYSQTETQSKTIVSGEKSAEYTYSYKQTTGYPIYSYKKFGAYGLYEYYDFSPDGKLTEQTDNVFKTQYIYDSEDRISRKKTIISNNLVQDLSYTYDTSPGATNRITQITSNTVGVSQNYTYTSRGYLSSYRNFSSYDFYNYTYDKNGRLISDTNATYSYTGLNNIASISRTNGPATFFQYESNNQMRLKSINTGSDYFYFLYDAMGNMTTYKGSSATAAQNLMWTRGNMLYSGAFSGNYAYYYYDCFNVRRKKVVNNVPTYYFYDGNVLLAEQTNDVLTRYFYDASGVCGMKHGDSYYYFEKNLFGDVVAVYNSMAMQVASFSYDSWGNIVSSSGSMADNVKFRYRGYYYDTESGFYYLQSRYYAPEIGRFISADQYDSIASLSQTLGQLNLYAYCNNNPIMFTDQNGESILASIIIGLIIGGAVIGGIMGGVNSNNTGLALVGDIMLGGITGGLTAALLALSLYGGTALIGFGAGAIGPALALAGGGVISSGAAVGVAAVAAGVGVIVTGGVIANQLGVLMAKGDGRRIGHNQYENKQFNDAVRSAGYDIKDPKIKDDLKAVHKYLRSRKTTPRYQELIQIIKEFLN